MKMVRAWLSLAGLSVCLASGAARAAKPTHKCSDDKGHIVYSDLPCPVVAVPPPAAPVPPRPLTAEQRRNAEHLERQFLLRYPDEDRHRALQLAGVQEVSARTGLTKARLSDLQRERKTIDEELAFYEHRAVPPELRRRLDASEARFQAITEVFHGLETGIVTMRTRYEWERRQFGFLWRGGAPGSSACAQACNG